MTENPNIERAIRTEGVAFRWSKICKLHPRLEAFERSIVYRVLELIACFFRHAARHGGLNVIRSASWRDLPAY
jgi:hypothetical protein